MWFGAQVRHIGLSNETSFGVMQFIRAAEEHDLPRVVSIQVLLAIFAQHSGSRVTAGSPFVSDAFRYKFFRFFTMA